MLNASMRGGEIVEPVSPEFLSLCEHAQVAYEEDPEDRRLAYSLSPPILSRIRNFIFEPYTLESEWMAHWGTSDELNTTRPLFSTWIQTHLPNLREFGLVMPLSNHLEQCINVLRDVLNLLADGSIKVVNLLFPNPLRLSSEIDDSYYLPYLLTPMPSYNGGGMEYMFLTRNGSVYSFEMSIEQTGEKPANRSSKYSWVAPETVVSFTLLPEDEETDS
ncbi:hypothetical protein GLAREA_12818 [Glarea lozoyensis ATCC 20868]|uniref:Uncharacterized protein n=1 Tax=Glarea lozoyensis (strain ATCC 20868 / MF5171) TaxID=1116229 RepID=S3CWQ9_GLAL2|nr:uncharacterized protein GLAREA_12818 [Glarea lozoyensis ATCC 20868]EPE30095.1 hypothetical protein GLAREA_12818 [Glarea lozoyensis ATCC 20868]